MSNSAQLVQKLWNYCSILRDDGLSYGDYLEQLTFLLFLKMAEVERRLNVVEAVVTANLQWAACFRRPVLQKTINGGLLNEQKTRQQSLTKVMIFVVIVIIMIITSSRTEI